MKKLLLLLILAATITQAYDNNTMTQAYRELTNNDPIHAVMTTYENVMGDWFYMLLAIGPYLGMFLYQRSLHIPTIWLTCVLAAYGFLFTNVPQYIFYMVAIFWVLSVLVRLLSPLYEH